MGREIHRYESLHTNARSISDSTGIPRETVRRKVHALIAAGWVIRGDDNLAVTPAVTQQPETGLPVSSLHDRCLREGLLLVAEVPFIEFTGDRYWIGATPLVGLAPARAVRPHASETALLKAFGGAVRYVDDVNDEAYLGVWEVSKVRRFRAFLEQSGVAMQAVAQRPPRLRLDQRRTA